MLVDVSVWVVLICGVDPKFVCVGYVGVGACLCACNLDWLILFALTRSCGWLLCLFVGLMIICVLSGLEFLF